MSNRDDPFAAFRRHPEVGVLGVPGVPDQESSNKSRTFSLTSEGTPAEHEGVPGVPSPELGTQGTPAEHRGVPDFEKKNINVGAGNPVQGTQGTPGTPELVGPKVIDAMRRGRENALREAEAQKRDGSGMKGPIFYIDCSGCGGRVGETEGATHNEEEIIGALEMATEMARRHVRFFVDGELSSGTCAGSSCRITARDAPRFLLIVR